MRSLRLVVALVVACSVHANATTYEVGPGKPYTAIGQVPWESLNAGDLVLIHWRAAPYHEKWVICRQGTALAPIIVRGVAGSGGELPIIDGNGATTRLELSYASEQRGIIKIGSANIPADTTPKFITIENLDIRNARSTYSYVDDAGVTAAYFANASAIYVEKGENITVRNCILHDCGNGFFVASSDAIASRNILVEGNHLYDNGNFESIYEHNNYTAAIGITFQYNRFGYLKSGASGNNLKDRSAGLVVRYNWIEGGNRQLDLVDAEDSVLIQNDPGYHSTHVYGNYFIEPAGAGNRQITHYGGDSGSVATYRKGTLHFFNNTLVSTRTDRTTLFRLSTNDETCDARNNIFYGIHTGNNLSILDETGVITLSHNWFKPGWVNCFGTLTGTVNNNGTSVQGTSPGFVNEAAQDFRIVSTSACVNTATSLHAAVLPTHNLVRHYLAHQRNESRAVVDALDIGAFEYSKVDAWRQIKFGHNSTNPAISGDLADPDLDGRNNLVEYALNLDPLNAAENAPAPLIQNVSGTPYLTLTFSRIAPPAEVSYLVEWTDDLLAGWNPGPSYTNSGDTTNVGQAQEYERTGVNPLQISVRRNASSTAVTHQLLRLQISRP